MESRTGAARLSSGDGPIPSEVLVPLLYELRSAYAAPELQLELQEAREAGGSRFCGTWLGDGAKFHVSKRADGLRLRVEHGDGTLEGAVRRQGAVLRGELSLGAEQVEVRLRLDASGRRLLVGWRPPGDAWAEMAAARPGHGLRCPPSWEQQAVLARVQAPIFAAFGLPPPPRGVSVLMNSIVASGHVPEVAQVGCQCRALLGQDGAGAEAPPRPEAPGPERAAGGVAVAPSELEGEGLVALEDFAAGQELLREEPLATLGPGPQAPLELLASGQLERVLASGLSRGPAGPKARELAVAADICLGSAAGPPREALVEALLIFGFNAFDAGESKVIFPLICKANHSCEPNCSVVAPATGPGRLVCQRPVRQGEELTVSYLGGRELAADRRERSRLLGAGWGFGCGCRRCAA